MLSSIFTGFLIVSKMKYKIYICEKLVEYANEIIVGIGYFQKPISNFTFAENIKLLNKNESKYYYDYHKSLGKFDVKNEIARAEAFKNYFESSAQKYQSIYNAKAKLYLSLSFGGGVVLCLLLI